MELDPTASAPAAARRHVMSVLPRWRLPPELLPDATRIASELAASALRSTLALELPEPTGLRLLCDRRRLVIEAWDCGPPVPAQRADANGQGLQVVERLANQWGIQRVSTHVKTLWAELLIADYLAAAQESENTFVDMPKRPLWPASDWRTPAFDASAAPRAAGRR